MSCLDNCSIQKAAVCLMFNKCKQTLVACHFVSLHWLLVAFCIHFRALMLCLQGYRWKSTFPHSDSEFQSHQTLNLISKACVFSVKGGGTLKELKDLLYKLIWGPERPRVRVGTDKFRNVQRCHPIYPCKTTTNSVLHLTSSQCKHANTGAMLSFWFQLGVSLHHSANSALVASKAEKPQKH